MLWSVMEAAREPNEKNPFDDVGGFGKFQKRPFRRSQPAPYNRPPTATRTSGNGGAGWLSKFVDPAQNIISSTARTVFASVLRKRLPPPRPLDSGPNEGAMDEQQETVLTDSLGARVAAVNRCDMPGGSSERDRDGITELELILKQKTFTRSEIDQLIALLQSKTVDMLVEDEEKKSETITSEAILCEDRKEKIPDTPVKENEIENCLISTPAVSSSVFDEDIASPAELAKAYMGSRSSKLSPSMLSLCNQLLRKESAALMNHPFPSTPPIMSVVPKSSDHSSFRDNGFVTPRTRSKSAIYSIARTPYSRVHSATMLQEYGTTIDAFEGPSTSSNSAWDWDDNRISGSKHGALKRRSSVLDNDIGSVSTIRRIRQKANLLPASGTLSICGNSFGTYATSQHPSLMKKSGLTGEPLKENGDNSLHCSGPTTVPSKSSEMALKILQQLDVLVSLREKSPAKLSPSMLQGSALRSLENVDSSKLLENVQDNKNGILLPGTRDYMSRKQEKNEENGTTKFITCRRIYSETEFVDTTSLSSDVKTTAVMNPVDQSSSQKKGAFQMSAREDYLELDDDDYSNGTKSATLALKKQKPDISLAKDKNSATEVITLQKPTTFGEINNAEGAMMNQKTIPTFNASAVDEKSSCLTFLNATISGAAVLQEAVGNSMSTAKPDEPADSKKLIADPPTFSSEEKLVLPKEPNSASLTSDFSCKIADKILPFVRASSEPAVSDSVGVKLTASDSKPENSSSVASVISGATDSMIREPERDTADDKNSLKTGVLRSLETVPPAVSTSAYTAISSLGTPANGSSLRDGSLFTSPTSFSSPSPLVSNNVPSQKSSGSNSNVSSSSSVIPTTATTTDATNGGSLSMMASTPFIMDTPIFRFGSSVPSTSYLSATVGVEPAEAETKETITGKASSVFVGTSTAMTSAGSSHFSGTSAAMTSAGSSHFSGTSAAMTSSGSSHFSGTSAAITSTSSPYGGTAAITSTSSLYGGTAAITSARNILNFNTGTTTSVATGGSQSFDSSSISASVQAALTGTGFASSSQSIPFQFSSSASPSSGVVGSTVFSSGGSLFSSSTAKPFCSGAAFGLSSSASSLDANADSSSSNTTTAVTEMLSSSSQAPKASIFGSTFSSSSSSSLGFTFGLSSASNTASGCRPMVFGSSTNALGASSTSNAVTNSTTLVMGSSTTPSSNPIFSFSSPAASTPPQPVFGNSNPSFAFGSSTPPGNKDQMEDSMAEDTVQAAMPMVPVCGQKTNVIPSSGFIFGSTSSGANPLGAAANPHGASAPSGTNPFGASTPSGENFFGATAPLGVNPFQFASQPNMSASLTSSPFHASGSLEFNAGGSSFSLGSGGGTSDKSSRKFIKVRKMQRKK